jgi:predicted protein tyrosine phosphatase
MEDRHRNVIRRRFRAGCAGKRLICAQIPDEYDFMDSGLVRVLEQVLGPHLLGPSDTA